ncbi:4-vinyl reductase [Anaerolineales bacterium HSG24]|nr:4-vinyl reductase [Anaerolineales bacterium HSG24]
MSIKKSNLFYQNKIARIYLMSIERTIGKQAMQKVYDLAEVPADDRPPPNNYARQFDFAYMGAVNAALGKMYGYRGEHALTTKAGYDSFTDGITEYGAVMGVSDLALKPLSLNMKMKVGLRSLTELFSKFSDGPISLQEEADYFIYTVHHCPVCWGRTSDNAICYATIAIVEAGLKWVSKGAKFRIEEVACHAVGDKNCVVHIWKEPL